MIQVVISDGNGTLQLENRTPSDEMRQVLQEMQSGGFRLAVASNSSPIRVKLRFSASRLPDPDYIVTRRDLGVSKPSPEFIYNIQEQARVELHEMVYLSDCDETDVLCALNAGVLPLAAKYSQDIMSLDHGIPIESPLDLLEYLSIYGKQEEPYFGWNFSGSCQDTGKAVEAHALVGEHSAHTEEFKQVLKHHRDVSIASTSHSLRSLLSHYLVSQCYLSGLTSAIDVVTVYPGHDVDSVNETLVAFSDTLAEVFRPKLKLDLLERHQAAPESKSQGSGRDIFDQFRTIRVNPACDVSGKTVLVIDDFTTTGHSLETARRMLLQAGAENVVGMAVAKFGRKHCVTRIARDWDPHKPCSLRKDEIRCLHLLGGMNETADIYFWDKIWAHYTEPRMTGIVKMIEEETSF
jgi:predicted amidophosphoribosyltransferase